MVYQQQPGDRILSGLLQGNPLDGRQLGNALLQFLPALPHEGPPVPRFLAQQLFPGGFLRPQPATLPVPTPEIIQAAKVVQPSIQPAQPVAAPQPVANQVVRTQVIPQPAPAGGYRSAAQGGEPISVARSQRIRIIERPGL